MRRVQKFTCAQVLARITNPRGEKCFFTFSTASVVNSSGVLHMHCT